MDMRERLCALKARQVRVQVHFRTCSRESTEGVIEDVADDGEVTVQTGVPFDPPSQGHVYFFADDALYLHVKEKIERKGE